MVKLFLLHILDTTCHYLILNKFAFINFLGLTFVDSMIILSITQDVHMIYVPIYKLQLNVHLLNLLNVLIQRTPGLATAS